MTEIEINECVWRERRETHPLRSYKSFTLFNLLYVTHTIEVIWMGNVWKANTWIGFAAIISFYFSLNVFLSLCLFISEYLIYTSYERERERQNYTI